MSIQPWGAGGQRSTHHFTEQNNNKNTPLPRSIPETQHPLIQSLHRTPSLQYATTHTHKPSSPPTLHNYPQLHSSIDTTPTHRFTHHNHHLHYTINHGTNPHIACLTHKHKHCQTGSHKTHNPYINPQTQDPIGLWLLTKHQSHIQVHPNKQNPYPSPMAKDNNPSPKPNPWPMHGFTKV